MRKKMTLCRAKTARGNPCSNPAASSGYCFAHDPDRKAEAQAARRLGGYHRRTAARVSGDTAITIASMQDVLTLINSIVADTWQQDNSAARSRALLACAEAGVKVLEQTEIEGRLAALEAALEEKRT
jgi:hypothetical protein